MKFDEIIVELKKKEKILENTQEHINSKIRELELNMQEVDSDLSKLRIVITKLDNLSVNAE